MSITVLGSLLKIELPATIILAPALAAMSMVSGPKPPSTCILRVGHLARKTCTCIHIYRECVYVYIA